MRAIRWMTAAMLAGTLAATGDTTTDPVYKFAWSENVGWMNACPKNNEVTVHYYEETGGWLSGYIWCENIGWIVMGNSNGGPYGNTTRRTWGVNVDANGDLSGYAWGENVGWISFDHPLCDAAINPTNGVFSGHAWGENIGWLTFKGVSPDYGVRSMAFYTQPHGTPNWWLDTYAVSESYDAGDGVQAWQKYVMDVDPTIASNDLRITAISTTSTNRTITFTPASTRRSYTLSRRDDLTAGNWSNVAGQSGIRYTKGSIKTLQDTHTTTQMFYRVTVTVGSE